MLDAIFRQLFMKNLLKELLRTKGSVSLVSFTLRQLKDLFLVVFILVIDLISAQYFKHILFMFLEKKLIVICFLIIDNF